MLTASGHPTEVIGDQPADGVEFTVFKGGAEFIVELGDFGDGLDAVALVLRRVFDDDDMVAFFVEIEFVFDVAHNLFKHVFNRNQPRPPAIFVDDDGQMITVASKILEQHIEPLGFRHKDGRAQQVAHISVFVVGEFEQFLGVQNAQNVVPVAFDHRKARVRGIDDMGQEFFRRLADVDDIHLRARHHDVAHGQRSHLQDAFDHGKRIGVD